MKKQCSDYPFFLENQVLHSPPCYVGFCQCEPGTLEGKCNVAQEVGGADQGAGLLPFLSKQIEKAENGSLQWRLSVPAS